MCGIIGATGEDDIIAILIDSLHRLEYRGYDSAGIALSCENQIWRARAAHGTRSVDELAEMALDAPQGCHSGIGHTRWATHGHPSVGNAHPHFDCTGRLALVHNGIIENHGELGAKLTANGHTLHSDTDTEVVVHLIEEGIAAGESLPQATRLALSELRGTFSIAVISSADPELIVATRRSTPLLVGKTSTSHLIASDIPALLERTRQIYSLRDDELVELRPNSMRVTNSAGSLVEPELLRIEWDMEAARKGGHDDFMSKEMAEQPKAVADTLLDRRSANGALLLDEMRLTSSDLAEVNRVIIVACGSSYHAGLVAKYAIEHWVKIPTEVDIASEFRYRDPVVSPRTLVVGVSQSGETLDTLQALREAKRWGAKVLAISNVVDSSMAREADGVLYTHAGPEIGVASTKCHLAQIVGLEVLALMLAQTHKTMSETEIAELLDQMYELPEIIDSTLCRNDAVSDIADKLVGVRDFFYLGRHVGFPIALEGALKLKELAYLRAEGYPAGELKHGPIALIEPGTVVVGVATNNPLFEKMLSNIAEVSSRGATVVLMCSDGDERASAIADHVMWVPPVHPLLSPVIGVVPLQQLAYRLARIHNHDVDRPRNLAKTVTVE